ncbi:protein kinase [Parabacteroides sp. OttesenSCG-928-B22]|nr:protein kinase [Parabacteroides sp. OttesenSCG-928-B22]
MNNDLFLGEYEIIASSNSHEGAFATVYKVRHKQLGYVRAIRVLKEIIHDEQDIKYQKFLAECKLLLRLGNGGHPNIVQIAQPRLLQGRALVEMEYVHGADLNDYIKEKNHFIPINEVLQFVKDISNALAYCHYDIYKFCINRDEDTFLEDDDEGNPDITPEAEKKLVEKYKVIHNDIHSKNIIRKYDGSYILLDFGLAIQNDTVVKSSTRKGGAQEYKAPEKWEDEGIITEQTDMYSLGILMYEMLTGEVPFPLHKKESFSEQVELRNKHQHSTPPSIEIKRKDAFLKVYPNAVWEKDYPDWLEKAIMKCLEKDPKDRFSNAKELLDFIQEYMKADIPVDKKIAEENTVRLKNEICDLNRKLEEEKQKKATSSSEEVNQLVENIEQYKKQLSLLTNKNKDLTTQITTLEKRVKEAQSPVKEKKTQNKIYWALNLLLIGILFFVLGNYLAKTRVETKEITYVTATQMSLNDETFTYTGDVVQGIPNGNGKAVFTDGRVYEGTFSQGVRTGTGVLTFEQNGKIVGKYEGAFVSNQFSGNGTYTYDDGSYYIGTFSGNYPNGTGVLFDKKGKVLYSGQFKDGNPI